jgi:hypothetical protein
MQTGPSYATIRRHLHLSLSSDTEILRFFKDLRVFSATFTNLVFCDVKVLQIPMPSADLVSHHVLKMIFKYLSPALHGLSVVFEGDSVVGADFMAILQQWAPSLQTVKKLKIRYCYYETDNEVCELIWKFENI